MTPDLENSILSSDLIKKHAKDHAYAHSLYSVITLYKLAKRSFVPMGNKDISDYSRRLAAVIVSKLRGTEDYNYWYNREPIDDISKSVQQDLKKIGWIINTKSGAIIQDESVDLGIESEITEPPKKSWWNIFKKDK